jgi:hypothetical protein
MAAQYWLDSLSKRPLEGVAIGMTAILNRKIWEEPFVCVYLIVIWISDTDREKTSVCTRNEVNKTIQTERLQCWYC